MHRRKHHSLANVNIAHARNHSSQSRQYSAVRTVRYHNCLLITFHNQLVAVGPPFSGPAFSVHSKQ